MNLIWGKLKEKIEYEIQELAIELDAYCVPGDEYDMYNCGSLGAFKVILEYMDELEAENESSN